MSDVEQSGSAEPTSESSSLALPRWLRGSFGVVVALLATMWVVEVVDAIVLDGRLERNGIQPRTVDGLRGIVWAPFLHGGVPHLISNTIPFIVLSALTLTGGIRRYLTASALIILIGGLLVWTFSIGSNENHIGSSGWVFGLFGFLIAAAWFEKRPLSIIVALLALFVYGGTILFGFVPRPGLSWEGHLFGFVAGLAAARIIVKKRPALDPDLPAIG
jgi:membrane associated rhomboid family serine protease